MKKRLELLLRLVDGGQLYWDVATVVEPITIEELESMMPRTAEAKLNPDVHKAMHEMVRAKFREAADRLFERAIERIR
jgi:hypothetical protein